MSKITVLCRMPRGLILTGPSPVRYAFDDATGAHRRESTHLELRHGINEGLDEAEVLAWVKRAADHGLKFERLLDAYVVSDGRATLAADQANVLERALSCNATVCAL